ncbi:E3 ubiquitin-protein ligase RNF220 isoform X2 [Folsomia candida]|uniref:E3 ubiquitin-protein ligase RNF220 isoform X2 n=1 Tax=Folsomia candida TaxID=158441 RepID=UPI0016052841|nr:E3 ubiquitin-protein ligase RNF220 isoform X2 [Folsomia candida]
MVRQAEPHSSSYGKNNGNVKVVKMEESSYVPNSSIPPALVVFSQGGCYGDAIRMQRPFGAQSSDAKDLNLSSLSPSSFGLRPMDSYPGLPAGLVHLQNPFLHPALEARLPFGTGAGAFRPVVTSSSSSSSTGGDDRIIKNLPSAFSTPSLSNRRKLEALAAAAAAEEQQHNSRNSRPSAGGDNFAQGASGMEKSYLSNGNNNNHRHRSCSPVNCSPNNAAGRAEKHEDRDGEGDYEGRDNVNGTPNSDITDRSTPDEGHISSKRRRRHGEIPCPVCKLSLHPMDLESHLLNEVEQLICISQIRRQAQLHLRSGEPLPCSSRDSPSNKKEGELSQDSRWDTYQRVRNNRHSRLRLKTRRRREESGGSGPSHPQVNFSMCRMQLHGSNEQLSGHLDVRKNGEIEEDDEPVDIEGDEDNDSRDANEYEWGNRRILKSSHNSSMTAINMTTSKRRDEEIDVDGDEISAYGCPQYCEADIQAVLKKSPSPSKEQDGANHSKENKWYDEDSSDAGGGRGVGPVNDNINLRMVIHALRTRIREMEKETTTTGVPNDGTHCHVCSGSCKKPVVSISCWHVHCEKCWLRSLGSKKLCPQCNMITATSDLRRIVL